MKTPLFSFVFLLLVTCSAIAQNGKIIEQEHFNVADSTIAKIKKQSPQLEEVIGSVDFYRITYMSDGLKVRGYMAAPKRAGIFPCIIYNRGGNRDFGAWTDNKVIRLLGEIASWGYVAVGSQYRGNGGGEGKEEFGGKDVNDILNMIPLLSHVEKADTSRIGMVGWSRGGMMTYLALTRTNQMKAAVIGSGMADGFLNTKKRPEMDTVFAELAPGYLQNRDSVLTVRSAVKWADKICKTTPLLLLTGSADWRVSPEEQLSMLTKLYANRHPVRYVFFEGGDHGLSEHTAEVNHNMRIFLDAYVRDRKALPNLVPHGR